MRCFCLILVLLVTVGGKQWKRGLSRSRRAAVPVRAIPWPNGVIPYIIDRSTFNLDEILNNNEVSIIHPASQELKEISLAMETWNNETCVKFRPYQRNDRNWVRITDGTRCYSNYMGHKGLPGEQLVSLSKNGCRYYGLYLHELGHVIGLDHEHVRNDRDKYLRVDLSGVPKDLRSFFKKKAKDDLETYNLPYDLQSVMHYGKSSFSVFANKAPIDVKNKETLQLLTDVYVKDVSFWDAKIVNLHYKCQDKCPNIQSSCQEPGYIDNNCKCLTPADFSLRRCVDLIDEKECDRKADKLECYRNASYMVTFCRKTCGFCFKDRLNVTTNSKYTECRDRHEHCGFWAKDGQCIKSASYMQMMCPESCGYCKTTITTAGKNGGSVSTKEWENCRDLYRYSADCETWAKQGKCEINKFWMYYNCAKSCRVCGPSFVKATPTSSKKTLTKTTTTAKPAVRCLDKYGKENCRRLEKRGFCKTHMTWMRQQCVATCGLCYREVTSTSVESAVITNGPSASSTRPPRANPPTQVGTKNTEPRSAKTIVLQTGSLKLSTTTAPRTLTTPKPQKTSKTLENLEVGLLAKEAWKHACQFGDPKGECPKSRAACKNVTSFLRCPNICKNCESCRDTSKNCAALKQSGYCTRYATSTVPICRKTCDACFTD